MDDLSSMICDVRQSRNGYSDHSRSSLRPWAFVILFALNASKQQLMQNNKRHESYSDIVNILTCHISKAALRFSIFNLGSICLDIPFMIYACRSVSSTSLVFITLSSIFGYVPEAIGTMICVLDFALVGEGWILRKKRRCEIMSCEGEGGRSDAS